MATLGVERTQKLFVEKLTSKYSLNLLGLKKAFSNFDKDQNGLLDLEEINNCISQFLAGISPESVKKLVGLYDSNGDGKISYEEFLAVLRNPKALREMEAAAEEKLSERETSEWENLDNLDAVASPGRERGEETKQIAPPAPTRRARAAAQPLSDRQSSIFSFNDEADSVVETVLDMSDSKELENRSRSFLYNLREKLHAQAVDLRHGGKVGAMRERLIISSTKLLDSVARGLLTKAFEPYCHSSVNIELGDFAKALRGFRLPGSGALRAEVIYFLFHLCKRSEEESCADVTIFETLVFGGAKGEPASTGAAAADNSSPCSPSRMAPAGVVGGKAEDGSWFGDDESPGKDPTGLGGLSLVDTAHVGAKTVATGPYAPSTKKNKDPVEVPLRFVSRKSRTAFAVPSSFTPAAQERSSKAPGHGLEQAHMYGMSCGFNSGSNVFALPSSVADPGNPHGLKSDPDFLDSSVILYAAGSTGIVHDLSTNTQAHFSGHAHEITCMALSHCGRYVVTGSSGAAKSSMMVWESTSETYGNPTALATVGEGFFERAVCAVSFLCDPNFVAGVGCDDGHSLGIWDIRNPGVYLVESRCQNGIPPQIKGMKWAPQQQYTEYISTANQGLCDVLCTVGEHHLKLWSFKRPTVTSIGTMEEANILQRSCIITGAIAKQIRAPKTYTCCDFIHCSDGSSDTVVGGSNGVVYLFRKNQCSSFVNAIRGGVTCLQVSGDSVVVGGVNGVVKVLKSRSLAIVMGFSTARSVPSNIVARGAAGGDVRLRPSSRGAVDAIATPRGSGEEVESPTICGITVLTNARGGQYAIASSTSGRTVKIDFSKFVPRPSSSASKEKKAAAAVNVANPSPGVSSLFHFHTGELWGLAVGTVRSSSGHKHPYIATSADDRRLSIWSPARRALIARTNLSAASRCCSFDPSCRYLAVGTQAGGVHIYQIKVKDPGTRGTKRMKGEAMAKATLAKQVEDEEKEKKTYTLEECTSGYRRDFKEGVSDVKFSPDGSMLAAGSNDDTICVYKVSYSTVDAADNKESGVSLRPLHRLKGHSSYISHLDWSNDGTLLRSTCGAYEMLHWEAQRGTMYKAGAAELKWRTQTCPLGFAVMGIWPKFSDGTDINGIDVLNHGKQEENKLVVTGDDDARVNLLNYPCVVKHAPRKSYGGHGAHVTNVRFFSQSDDITAVASTGGRDASLIVWEVTAPPSPKKVARTYNQALF